MAGQGKMLAAILYGPGQLKLEERPIPEPGPGEVVARVRAATTCGTDVKMYARPYVSSVVKLPSPFGHEWAGEVIAVGPGVEEWKPGDRIRAGNSAPCLTCRFCRRGQENLCENRLWLWGAFAEYIRVPAHMLKVNAQKVPDGLSYEEAAVAEPLACVLHGAKLAGVRPGDVVVVIGSGPIGILHAQVAKHMGAVKVIISDMVDERLRVARSVGADITVNVREEELSDVIEAETDGLGADVVIEAVGLPETWEEALKLVRRGGTVLEFGGCPPGTSISVSTEKLHYGELKLLGAFHATPRDFEVALSMIASGSIRVKPLITSRRPLGELPDVLESLMKEKKDLKVAIIP